MAIAARLDWHADGSSGNVHGTLPAPATFETILEVTNLQNFHVPFDFIGLDTKNLSATQIRPSIAYRYCAPIAPKRTPAGFHCRAA